MNRITIKKAEIEWWDSYATLGTWHDAESALNSNQAVSIKTLGWIYKQEKDRIHIAMSIHFEGKDITRLGALFTIPRGCITQITYL